ncbi:hypothetical protein KH5_22650 [Urechidicola sp. KH5]
MKKYFTLLFLFSFSLIFAQEEDAGDLAKKIQNPIANLISVPFQNNFDFGKDIRPTNTLNIQPVYPISISENLDLITRAIVPVVSAPIQPEGRLDGIGNITLATFFTSANPGKVIWGAGPTFMFPSVEQGLGFDKFGIAPSGIALYQNNGWTLGCLAQNFFGVAGNSNADLNFFYTQIFAVKNLKKGWYVNSAPIITSNWDAPSGSQWTVPIGAGFGKLSKVGKLPINWQTGIYKYIEHPGNADYQLRLQVVLLFPK